MKHLKKLFYALACCLLALCIFILVVALNPPMSEEIANMLYGENGILVTQETPEPEETQEPPVESEVPIDTTQEPVMTPMPLFTSEPEATYDPDVKGAVYVISTTLNNQIATPYVESNDYIVVPKEVSGLSGFIPIEGEFISQSEDDEELPGQSTGTEPDYEDLYFEQLYYPYYHMLDSREQLLYNQIYANLVEVNEKIIPYESFPSSTVKTVFEAVYNDHPELFYVDTAFSCKVNGDSRVIAITLKYNELAQDLTSAKQTFDLRAGEILSEAKALVSNYDKEKFVHDKLTELVSYSSGAALSQSAYSALVNNETVCAGYARAFQYLMQQLGIPCYYCTGYSGVNHAWNIVYLYGDYYNVDVTWDDTDSTTYDYFNRTDADFAKTHQRKSLSVNLPACLGTTYRDIAVVEEDEANEDIWGEEEDPLEKELQLYYDTCYERIVDNGMGTKEYVDVYSADMWKQICKVYENGQVSEAFFTRAFHTTGGSSMAMRVQGQLQENGTYKVTHTIVID